MAVRVCSSASALYLCDYYYLICFNCLSSGLSMLGSQPGHCPLPFLVQIKDLCHQAGINNRIWATGSQQNYLSAWDRPEGKPSWHCSSAFLRVLLASGGTATCMTCSSGLSSTILQPQVHFLTPLKHFGGVFFQANVFFFFFLNTSFLSSDMSESPHPFLILT